MPRTGLPIWEVFECHFQMAYMFKFGQNKGDCFHEFEHIVHFSLIVTPESSKAKIRENISRPYPQGSSTTVHQGCLLQASEDSFCIMSHTDGGRDRSQREFGEEDICKDTGSCKTFKFWQSKERGLVYPIKPRIEESGKLAQTSAAAAKRLRSLAPLIR